MNNHKYLGLYIGNTIPNSAFDTSSNNFKLTDIPIDYKPMCIKATKDKLQLKNIDSSNYFYNFKIFIGQCYSDIDEDTLSFYEKIISNDGDEIKIRWIVNKIEKSYTVEQIISTLISYFYNLSFRKISLPKESKLSVVLTYPLYYNLFQKLSFHDIVIDSQIELSYYIPEPVASIITYIDSDDYKPRKQNNGENIVVLHCGGKTTTISEYNIYKNEKNGNTELKLIYYNLLSSKKGLVYMIERYIVNKIKEDIDCIKKYSIHNNVIDYIITLTDECELETVDDITIEFNDLYKYIIEKYHKSIIEMIPKDDEISYIITTGTCCNPFLTNKLSDSLKKNCINIPILDEKTQKGTESIGAAIYGEKYGKYKIIPVLTYDITLKLEKGYIYLAKKYTVLPFESDEIIINRDNCHKYSIDICAVGVDEEEILIDSIVSDSSEIVRVSVSVDEKEKIVLHISTSDDEMELFPGFDPFY